MQLAGLEANVCDSVVRRGQSTIMTCASPISNSVVIAEEEVFPSRVWVDDTKNGGSKEAKEVDEMSLSMTLAPIMFRDNHTKISQQAMSGVRREFLTPTKYRVTVPGGFPYSAYDSRAKLQPHGILRMFECARTVSYYDPASEKPNSFMDMGELDQVFFMASLYVRFNEELYNPQLEKRPTRVDSEVYYLGETTFTNKEFLYVGDKDSPLVEGDSQFVFIDLLSRKPGSPPEWFKQKYEDEVKNEGEPLIIPVLHIPESVAVCEDTYAVCPSDIDANMHVNWTNYVRICMDTYIKWHIQNFGYENNGDPFRSLKTLQQNFRGESKIGDTLNISFWQNKTNEDKFHFLIKKSSRVICECTLEFFPLAKQISKL